MLQAPKIDLSNPESATVIFLNCRPKPVGVAYRMLGTVADAEDFVQETWLRWQVADRTVVIEPVAYLVAVTTRIAINVSHSAHSRLQTYIGPWLVAIDAADGESDRVFWILNPAKLISVLLGEILTVLEDWAMSHIVFLSCPY